MVRNPLGVFRNGQIGIKFYGVHAEVIRIPLGAGRVGKKCCQEQEDWSEFL